MLRIYSFIIETISLLRPDLERIERRDGDLARQMRRALASIALNTAEGEGSRGRNQQARFHTALGSARESLACLEVAAALGYAPRPGAAMQDRFGKIIGTLTRLSR